MKADIYKPDLNWAQSRADQIARLADRKGVDKSQIQLVEIYCGNGSIHGFVILDNGDRIQV
ncbi:MAG: hypothetical protein AAFY26_09450 [Cyanobacteria bacterium J06638_22]